MTSDSNTWSPLLEASRPSFPRGNDNLGVAHGVPGVIALLARLHTAGVAGDPGIAVALLAAARAAGEPAWEREARALALAVARRPAGQCGIKDAGLCHGAAGLGHLCNRLFQATGEPELAAAARRWFRQTLDDRRPGQGVGGYLSWSQVGDDFDHLDWTDDPAFLTGAAGIGLALLAATTGVEPAWDRILLASPLSAPSS